MKLFYFTSAFGLLLSCKTSTKNEVNEPIKLQIDQVYKTGGGMAEEDKGDKHVDMAYHYLILKEYNEEDASSWADFVRFADDYRDTAQTTLPLSSITICKPYRITTNLSGGEGWEEFREHFMLTIDYSHQTMHEKLADISGLIFWKNGKSYSIDMLTDKRMKKLGGYFDSSGKYNEKWWDRYKNQIPVDHEFDSIEKLERKR